MGVRIHPLPKTKTQSRNQILLRHFYFNTFPIEMSSEVPQPYGSRPITIIVMGRFRHGVLTS